MPEGLNINRLVRVTVNLAPLAAARRGFGVLLAIGDSNVIDGVERIRTYDDLEGVAADFGTSATEYDAAVLYFGQTPRPAELAIGRWLRTATAGLLKGGILTTAEQLLSLWTAITDGSLKVTFDGGAEEDITLLDFNAQTNLNGVAAIITTALTGGTCAWDGSRFIFTSLTTGATSAVSFLDTGSAGTDISAMLKGTAATALTPIPGFALETPLAAIAALADVSGLWYGSTFAAATMPTDDDLVAVGGFIEAASPSRIFGVTEIDTLTLDAVHTTDLASRFKALLYKRTVVQYSPNEFAICSLFGRAFSVNFNANRSTITLMYKLEPGVIAENLTATQASTLKDKRCNVFVNYQNDTAIIQHGVMSGPAYFDETHGLDWFADAIQVADYNLLFQSKTKIPQTDAGANQLVAVETAVCQEAVNNGLVAPGQWNAVGVGQLSRGDFLTEGFYIFQPPMASQDQSEREQRKRPPAQIALKLAGAIHESDVIVDVNR